MPSLAPRTVECRLERTGRSRGLSCLLRGLVLALGLLTLSVSVQAQELRALDLDLELALLVDVSASVNDGEYQLQAQGLATAFRSRAVLDAIRTLAFRGMAVAVIQWADQASQQVSIGWTLIRDQGDAIGLAAQIAAMPRVIRGGHTAIGNALAFGLQALDTNRFAGLRRVIDVSGDGRVNDGRPLPIVREAVLAQGITINGLAILNEIPRLDVYFRDHLIGGEGAFLVVASDYGDFAQAMTEKLVREIRSVPLANNSAPAPLENRQAGVMPAWRPGSRSN